MENYTSQITDAEVSRLCISSAPNRYPDKIHTQLENEKKLGMTGLIKNSNASMYNTTRCGCASLLSYVSTCLGKCPGLSRPQNCIHNCCIQQCCCHSCSEICHESAVINTPPSLMSIKSATKGFYNAQQRIQNKYADLRKHSKNG
jgi:hypothetical protein